MEIDSFYRRNQPLADATDALNLEVNKRLMKALDSTVSCDLENLFTNVHKELTSGNSGFGVISGMENWVEASDKIEKIQPPPMEQSIYWGTAFDSIWSVGFWLHIYQASLDEAKFGVNKVKKAIRWARGYTNDPIVLCKVPEEQMDFAKRMIETGGRPFPGGPPPGGKLGSSPSGMPPGGPPPESMRRRGFTERGHSGPPPEFGEKMKKIMDSAEMKCVREQLGISSKGTGALQVVINLNGSRVGADKVGHFFDTGGEYFNEAYSIERGEIVAVPDGKRKALAWGLSSEEGMFGRSTTGIKSYGDLAANYSGMKFWEALTGTETPYVKCVAGRFQQQRSFDFREFVDASWDEGINCSEYSTKEMTDRVNAILANLGLRCPVERQACERLSVVYGDVAEFVLSPICRAGILQSP